MKGRPQKGEFIKTNLYPERFDDCRPHSFPRWEGRQQVGEGTVWKCGYCGREWELKKTKKKDDHFEVIDGLTWEPITPPALLIRG